MKRITFSLLLATCFCFFSCNSSSNQKEEMNYAKLVDTRIGSFNRGEIWGKTFIGAAYPFGLMQMTPTFDAPHKGIVLNQVSGPGCSQLSNFPFLPVNGSLEKSPNDMNDFPVYEEIKASEAGYLSLRFAGDILSETTASKYSGMNKFTFSPNSTEGTIVIGSGINTTSITDAKIQITSPSSCEGYAAGGDFCGFKTDYKVYFAAEFNKPAIKTGTWSQDKLEANSTEATGENSGGYFTFDVSKEKALEYKVAISYVSIENAKENLKLDNQNRSFDQMRTNVQQAWNEYLGKIEIEGATNDQLIQFYTHWYHTLIHPNIFNDINGEYMGADFKVHRVKEGHDYYTTFSAWDTYRTQSQILAMIFPKESSDMMQSAIDFANQAGGFGRWVLANIETGIMHGDPMPIIIANTYAFGGQDFDLQNAYQHMKKGAMVPDTYSQEVEVRPGLATYLEKGIENASLCLEYTSSDYAIGQFALQALNNKEDGEYFINRAGNWKNLYDPTTNWLRSRNKDDMSWKDPDDDWREATKVNYFWMVPYDLETLIDTIGGKEFASKRLDSLFVRLDAQFNDKYFAAGNEPDFQVPWIYNWTDKPYKTSAITRRILTEEFSSKPAGLPGNDDLGATGSWFVYMYSGLFPMIPGVAGFTISAPQVDLMKMHFPKGTLTIKRDTNATYIKGLTLNGEKRSTWIDWKEIENGGVLEYQLSEQPNTEWGIE